MGEFNENIEKFIEYGQVMILRRAKKGHEKLENRSQPFKTQHMVEFPITSVIKSRKRYDPNAAEDMVMAIQIFTGDENITRAENMENRIDTGSNAIARGYHYFIKLRMMNLILTCSCQKL